MLVLLLTFLGVFSPSLYSSARMALYHYELQHYLALMATTTSMESPKVRETREEIQNSLANVMENFRGLNRRHLTRWLPISMYVPHGCLLVS